MAVKLSRKLLLLVMLCSVPGIGYSQAVDSYLPLAASGKWVLRNPQQQTPAVFEILRKDGDGFHFLSSTPWSTSEWVLVEKNGTFVMTKYGTNGQMMPLPSPVFLDFTRRAGAKWSNMLGTFEVVSVTASVKGQNATYNNAVSIRHVQPNLVYTFAKGIGFVQFTAGGMNFILDPAVSSIPGRDRAASAPAVPPAPAATPIPASPSADGKTLIGLTFNRMANEANTSDVLLKRFNQTVDAGVTFILGNTKWTEIEPRAGQYELGNLNYLVSVAKTRKLPLSYTFRIVDTIFADTPSDLKGLTWNSPRMKDRVVKAIEAMAPSFQGQVRWFMFGYELDPYFEKNPDQIRAFAELYDVAAARLKQLVPGIQVSSTITYSTGLDKLNSILSPLNSKWDFLALTYIPLEPGFTVEEPSVVPANFDKMRRAAGNRKIFFQELAYPTGGLTKGSQDKQAEFYRLVLSEFRKDNGAKFVAANFMTLADLSDADTNGYANFYGLNLPAFKQSLQTLGLFDMNGRAKKSWEIFRKYLASN